MPNKITLIKKPDGNHVIEASFNIGKVAPADSPDSPFITIPMGVQSGMQMLGYTLKNFDREELGWEERFDQALDQYCKQWMLDKLGLTQHPLQYDSEGRIEGLKSEYKIAGEPKETSSWEALDAFVRKVVLVKSNEDPVDQWAEAFMKPDNFNDIVAFINKRIDDATGRRKGGER